MGGERPHTTAELAQIERDQQHPEFLQWLAQMDTELRVLFTEDVPDMPTDPWTVEGLQHAEQAALRYYWADDPMDLDWPERANRFARYLGEVFVRNFEGRWKYIDMTLKRDMAVVVSLPAAGGYFAAAGQVTNAMIEGKGDVWAWLFDKQRSNYEAWVAAGRLAPKEWFDYQLEQDRLKYGSSR